MKTKTPPQVCSAENLANFAIAQWTGQEFREILTNDGNMRDDAHGKWFVCVWHDNCRTSKHLSDADIHGPFNSESEAEEMADVFRS